MKSTSLNFSIARLMTVVVSALLICTSIMAANTNDNYYRWYTDVEELCNAVKKTNRPVFFFYGKSNCSACDHVWDDYLLAETTFLAYMKENKLLGFHIENSVAFTGVVKMLKSNYDFSYEDDAFGMANEKVAYYAPVLAFTKVNPDATDAKVWQNDLYKSIYGVCGLANSKLKNYKNVTTWLDKIMATSQFQEDFAGNKTLTFNETIDEITTEDGECFNTAGAVQTEEVIFQKDGTTQIVYDFEAQKGMRYIFSGKNLPTESSPKLTCEISSDFLSTPIKKSSANGFEVLDKGFFFEPLQDGKYTLSLTLDTALSQELSFELHYHCMEYPEENEQIEETYQANSTELTYKFTAKKGMCYVFSGSDLPTGTSPKMTCKISGGNLSTPITETSTKGFDVLDKGILFKPTQDGDYTLTMTLNTASTKKISFKLLYQCMEEPENVTEIGEMKYVAKSSVPLTYEFTGKEGICYIFSGNNLPEEDSPKMTCEISGGNLSTPITETSTKGFDVLENGIFFKPSEDGDYTLTMSLDNAPTKDISFKLNYSCLEDSAKISTFAMPMWSGAENGKWALYDAKSIEVLPDETCFLLCFGGYAWCPHCIALDKILFETEAFEKATKEYPLIYVDNRRRGDITGPSLLYGDSYQDYMTKPVDQGGAGIAEDDLDAEIEAKLAANKKLQEEYQLDKDLFPEYNLTEDRIRYPSLFLCKKTTNGKFSVIERVSPWYPPYNEDVEEFAANFIKKLLDMKDDTAEESDDWAGTTTRELTLNNADITDNAKIGGFDKTDWRILDCSKDQDWVITLSLSEDAKEYDSTATISLKLFKINGHDTSEGTCLQSAYGTWEDPPQLELRGSTEDKSLRLKVCIEDGQDDAVIPYNIICKTADLPPYDIQHSAEEYYVTDSAGTFDLPVLWYKMEETNQQGSFKLNLKKGTTDDSFDIKGEQDFGTIQCSISNLRKSLKNQPYSQDYEATLQNVSNCRIKGNATAQLRVFTLPAFVDYTAEDYANNSTPTLPIIIVQNHEMEKITLDFKSGSDAAVNLTYSGNLPAGITAELNSAGNAVIISGKPTENTTDNNTVTVKIALQDSESKKSGGSINLAFTILSSEDYNSILALYNETAANTIDYTGRIASDSNEVLGTISIHRNSEQGNLSVEITGSVYETNDALTMDDWSISYSGEYVYSYKETEDITLYVNIDSDGYGCGYLTSEGSAYEVLFTPNLTSATEDDYLGTYNVSLESTHTTFQGYGFMTIEVKEDGSFTYSGELPNGIKITNGESHLVEEDGEGIITFFAKTEGSDTLSGRLSIVKTLWRLDGEACISACNDGETLAWHLEANDAKTSLIPCGTEFDNSTSLKTLLESHDSLNLFVYEDNSYELDDLKSTSHYLHASLLHHIPITLPNTIGKCSIDTNLLPPANLANKLEIFPEIADMLTIRVASGGMLNGSFKAIIDGKIQNTLVDFNGIFVPISASCCSSGPDFIASGKIVEKDSQGKAIASYPVWIIPQEGTDEYYEDFLNQLSMPDGLSLQQSDNSDKYFFNCSSENDGDGTIYVLQTKSNNAYELSENGNFEVDYSIGDVSITTAKAGCILSAKPTQYIKTNDMQFKLVNESSDKRSKTSTPGGWWALAFNLPQDTLFLNQDLPITYTLNEKTRIMEQSPMPLDKPFFFYCDDPDNFVYTIKVVTLTSANGETGQASAEDETEQIKDFNFTSEPDKKENYEIYYWNSKSASYSPESSQQPVDNTKQGVWCKPQPEEQE